MNKKKMVMIAPNFYGIDKSIRDSFVSFGFEVVLKNTRNRLEPIEALSLKILKKASFAEKVLTPVLKSYLDRDNEEYLSLINRVKPDILFVIKGETIYPDTLAIVRNRMKIPCMIYQWDCPFYSFSGHAVDVHRKNNFAKGMQYYDHIFSHDPYYVNEIKARGAKSVSYLPLATDPGQYKDINVTDQEKADYDFDVCFVGAPFASRIEMFNSLREFKLGVFGDGWEVWHRMRLKRVPDYYRGKATGDKVLKLYKTSRIVLNIHGPEAKEGLNTRTFDIPACGAFELTDYRPELDRFFKVGQDIAYYKDIDELKKMVRYYLENPEKRRDLIENGRAKVLENHTWRHRIQEVVKYIDSELSRLPQ